MATMERDHTEPWRDVDIIIDITHDRLERNLPRLLDIECQGVRACADHGGHHDIDGEVP